MCIMLTEHEPVTTKLIHLPVKLNLNGKYVKYNMCIYVNNLDTNGVDALMIVPFPKKNDHPVGMVDINTKDMKSFRKRVYNLFPEMTTRSLKYSDSMMYSTNSVAIVHSIGNYNISIVENIEDLFNRIDFTKFNKPYDFEDRVETLRSQYLYPTKCVYVVAQAKKNVKDDGFAIVYPDIGVDYFPTAHEQKNDTYNFVKYDVECYHFTNLSSNKIPFGDKALHCDEYEVKSHISNILNLVNTQVTLHDSTKTTLKCDNVKRVNKWKINMEHKNKNMYIKNETMWKEELK